MIGRSTLEAMMTTSTHERHGRRQPVGQLSTATAPAVQSLTLRDWTMPAELRAALVATRGERSLLAAVEFPGGEIPWHGVIMFTDTDTSDYRRFPLANGSTRDLPLPLMANLEIPEWGHVGAFSAGRIETFTMASGACNATGFLNDPTADNAPEEAFDLAYALAVGNIRGVSVDLAVSDADFDPVRWDEEGYPIEWRMLALEWQLMGATITPHPAFSGAYVALDIPGAMQEAPTQISPEVDTPPSGMEPDDEGDGLALVAGGARPAVRQSRRALTAAACGAMDLGLATLDAVWDPAAAAGRVLDLATDDAGTVDEAAYSAAFLWHDDTVDGVDGYRLGFADVNADGSGLLAVPAGLIEAAAAVNGGVDGMPDAEATTIRGNLDGYFEMMRTTFADDTIVAPWAGDGNTVPPVAPASITVREQLATSFPLAPERSWFEDPGFDDVVEPRYLGTGRCYGYVALFDVCHIGFEDVCVCAPHSVLNYALANSGSIRCADGSMTRVGHLTMGTGHAADYLGPAASAAHYDNTGTAYADVRFGEDERGVWFAGAMRRTITDDEIRVAQASALSGDWRGVNGNLELVAALAVNTPGFAVYKALVASGHAPAAGLAPHLRVIDGVPVSLTASTGVTQLARLVSRRQEAVTLADHDVLVADQRALRAEVVRLSRMVGNLDGQMREAARARLG